MTQIKRSIVAAATRGLSNFDEYCLGLALAEGGIRVVSYNVGESPHVTRKKLMSTAFVDVAGRKWRTYCKSLKNDFLESCDVKKAEQVATEAALILKQFQR